MRSIAAARAIPARDRLIIAKLIDALPEAVIVIDASDRVLAVNPPALALFPALRPDLLLARGLRAPDVLDCVIRARASGSPKRATWLERVPVERLFELHVAAMEAPPASGTMILTLRDLSEVRRVERMRVDFIANASHELRTPLASLLGFVETLQGPARAGDIGHRLSLFGGIRHGRGLTENAHAFPRRPFIGLASDDNRAERCRYHYAGGGADLYGEWCPSCAV